MEEDNSEQLDRSSSVISRVSDEVMILIMMYLRATDFATLSEVDKSVFSRHRISMAIKEIMRQTTVLLYPNSPFRKNLVLASSIYRPESLFVFENMLILSALTYPAPPFGKGTSHDDDDVTINELISIYLFLCS